MKMMHRLIRFIYFLYQFQFIIINQKKFEKLNIKLTFNFRLILKHNVSCTTAYYFYKYMRGNTIKVI